MLFKRKKKTDDTQLHIESIPDESTKGFNVVEICEQMVDAARELEDNRTEYALVTNYLTDIERMENMSETDKKTMNDAAANIMIKELFFIYFEPYFHNDEHLLNKKRRYDITKVR